MTGAVETVKKHGDSFTGLGGHSTHQEPEVILRGSWWLRTSSLIVFKLNPVHWLSLSKNVHILFNY